MYWLNKKVFENMIHVFTSSQRASLTTLCKVTLPITLYSFPLFFQVHITTLLECTSIKTETWFILLTASSPGAFLAMLNERKYQFF